MAARQVERRQAQGLARRPLHPRVHDSTKMACPDLRHRVVLHNADLGTELAARAFPGRPDARAVALRHVDEDLGCTPTLAEWLDGCNLARLPRPLYRRLPLYFDGLAGQVARAQGLRDDDGPQGVLDLLLLPMRLAGPDALGLLLNGAAPAIVRQIVGAPRAVPGAGGGHAIFDPAHAAEAVIYWLFGTIPPLSDVAAAVQHVPGPHLRST